jgi:hypothetical protein
MDDAMTRTVIFHSDRFDLVSYGNGLSYALHDNIAQTSMFVQDDDAAAFRDETGAFGKTCPEAPYDSFFAEQLAIRE